MPYRVAVDAWNLAADSRGMGRYVRTILREWEIERELDITLIVKNDADATVLRAEFPFSFARRGQKFDAVWYPWNGMRFEPHARSVLTLHDAFAFTLAHRNAIARWREQAPIKRGIARASALVSNSAWTAAEAARVFTIDPARFTVIHPVPDRFWRPVETGESVPYILVVGGTDERKNLRTLFSAFARAFPERSVVLRVAGTLNDDDEHRLKTSPFRFERVRPSDEELRRLYCGAIALAVPSTHEGYGIMAVEAMACGTPVIASNASALPEACDGAAVLVAPTDVHAWAHTLARIVSDADLRRRLGAASLARVERIDRTAPARETLALLRGVDRRDDLP